MAFFTKRTLNQFQSVMKVKLLQPWLIRADWMKPPVARAKSTAIPEYQGSSSDLDTAKLHLTNQDLHRRLGPIYRQVLGPDVPSVVWVSDPRHCQTVFRNEPPTPINMVPSAWRTYNKVRNLDRGLLFMEGEEWLSVRSALNLVLLKHPPYTGWGEIVSDRLVRSWQDSATSEAAQRSRSHGPCDIGRGGWSELEDLELQLQWWSVRSMLANLYGQRFFDKGRLEKRPRVALALQWGPGFPLGEHR